MIPYSRSDLFIVALPRIFIPKSIKAYYDPYVFRMPTMINDVSELVNYSIQSVTIPTLNYEPVQQTKPEKNDLANHRIGKQKDWRSTISVKDLPDRSFTITFSLLDGFINYWIMLSTYYYYYDFNNRKTHTYDIPIRILDGEGNIMFSVIFKEVLFTGISEYTISYSDLVQEFRTFDCTFTFNEMEQIFAPIPK